MTCLPEATLLSHLVLFGVSHQCISKVAIQALIFVQNYFKLSLFFPQNFHLRKVVDKRYLYNFTAQVYILFTLILNLDSNRSCVSYVEMIMDLDSTESGLVAHYINWASVQTITHMFSLQKNTISAKIFTVA